MVSTLAATQLLRAVEDAGEVDPDKLAAFLREYIDNAGYISLELHSHDD